MRILVTDGMDCAAKKKLVELGHEVMEQFYPPEALGTALQEFDAVIIRSATKIRKPQIDAAAGGKLKLIIRAGVGTDNIDIPAAEAVGITVRATPLASTNAVAEMALAHLFSCARFIGQANFTMKEGKWEKKALSKGFELTGKTMGVIGYGRIGKRVGDIAQELNMKVLAYDPYPRPEFASETMRYVSMEELLANADVITLHLPAMGEPIITAERIAKMKDGVIIINTSRGANVDEDALLDGLNSGKVCAAGLDVWHEEPAKNMALICHPNVSCTPHIGASTVEAQARIGVEIVSIIEQFA